MMDWAGLAYFLASLVFAGFVGYQCWQTFTKDIPETRRLTREMQERTRRMEEQTRQTWAKIEEMRRNRR